MKYLLLILIIWITTGAVNSQSVSVEAVSEHRNFSQSEYPLKSGSISFSANQLSFGQASFLQPAAWSVSPGREKVAVMRSDANLILQQLDYSGKLLTNRELEFFDTSDETLELYQFDDGRVVTRDNVANFSFFGANGELVYSISNTSGSPDGERESQLATDSAGKTLVLYNPVISFGNTTGSQARLVYGEEDHAVFFEDNSSRIEELKVTEDGSFISILATDGSSDMVYVFDRFGNELFDLKLDDRQSGITISKGAGYVTVYSTGRVQVYNILTGERTGSSTSRSAVFYASYLPEDEVILVLGGSVNGNRISNPMVTAIHVSKRQIARQEVDLSLAISNTYGINIRREGSNQYFVKGLNRDLRISTGF
jgi:hypothetical protein